jgi:hypothetical protein
MTIRAVEQIFTAPGTSAVLKDMGKDLVNVAIDFDGTGTVVVELSYDQGARWMPPRS